MADIFPGQFGGDARVGDRLMAVIGQLCLWIGFLGGALATVFRLEVQDAPWTTIPWGAYGVSLAVGIVGVVLLRNDRSQQRNSAAETDDAIDSVKAHLIAAHGAIQELQRSLDGMSCEDVLSFIDDRCVASLTEFADGREAILNHFGAAIFAEVMTEFASGERYLNRAWSAAADGYVDEVERSVNAAMTFLDAAITQLAAAQPEKASSS